MQNQEYQPFNDEWRKEIKKMPKSMIESIFGVDGKGFNKNETIEMARTKLIVEQFNEKYPVGSFVKWRNTRVSEPEIMTVKCAAFFNYGNPVIFFEEVPHFCSIEPDFLVV